MAQSPRQRTCHEVLYSVDSYGAACCQFQSTPCVWCSAFRGSPPPISQTENDPYVRIAGEVDADSSLIGFFMRDHEESEDCSSKADLVEDFCAGANIAPQEWETDVDANEDANTRPIALVDDRSNDGRTAVSRTNPGPLTAEQLLWYLSTMVRFRKSTKIRREDDIQTAREPLEVEDSPVEQPNADRRLLFIANLDFRAILALVCTAPEGQARALRDSIYNHLAFKASFLATISRDGLPSFRLAFDLPFHELRAETAIEYLPRRGDGGVLRFSEDVSFLAVRSPKSSNAATGTSKYHLCEAHVSCVVWGTNNSRWEAVMFLDIFSGSRESIVEYEYDPDNPGQMEQDPLRAGKAADRLILDPRLYFLDTFAVRIKRVKGKWRDLFDTLNLEIKASIHAYQQNLPWSSTFESHTADFEDNTKQIKQAKYWTIKTISVLAKLMQSLSSTGNQWTVFNSQRAAYFGSMESSVQQTLQTIQDTFLQLNVFYKDFEHLRDSCEQLRNDCLSDLQHRSMKDSMATADQTKNLIQMLYLLADKQYNIIEGQHEVLKKQQETGERSRATETVMLIVALITSVIAIFSIPKESSLFPTDPSLFILVVVIFGLAAYAIQAFLVEQSRCLKFLNRMLRNFWHVTADIYAYLSHRVGSLRRAMRRRDSDRV